MRITGDSLRAFRKDFMECVLPLQEKYGVTISLGDITYETERFSARLTVKNGRDGEDIARNDFDADVWRYAHLGLAPGMYNRMFIGRDGKQYAIQGFNTRAKKYPLKIVQFEDGQKMTAGEGFIMELLDEYYVESEQV